MQDIQRLCAVVRQIGYAIHVFLGPGHLEKVYENAFVNRLCKAGLRVEQQYPITVYDEDGTCIGEYFADLFIENCLIVELEAAKTMSDEHIAQILGYLRATRIKDGMIINFGAAKYQPRKFVMSLTTSKNRHKNAKNIFCVFFVYVAMKLSQHNHIWCSNSMFLKHQSPRQPTAQIPHHSQSYVALPR